MYQISQLENGLAVATARMPHMASASLGIWVGVGGRHEPKEISGVSHFIEHLLFKGTRKRSAREISQAVEGLGGYLNAFTGEENSCFYCKGRHEHFGVMLDVLADMFLGSRFELADIDKERQVIKEEIAMYLDQPHQQVQELLNETLWPDQPLGRSITGSKESLDRIGRKQMLGYQKANYVARATLIAAAGHVEHAQVVQSVKKYARKFPLGSPASYTPAVARQTKPALRLVTKATEQTQMALGIRACSRHDQRRFALRMLNAVLGENMSSRLFQTIREEQGLAYSIYSVNSFFDDAGDLVISAGLDLDKLEKTLGIVLGELRRLREQLVPRQELHRAREYLIGQLDLSLESSESQMTWVGENWLAYGRIIPPQEIKDRLKSVQAGEVRAAARELFRPDRYNLALVSPLKRTERLERLLAKG
jgi:predicted Zn-dependent peptidase